jgi:hypothetical protein
VDVVRTDVSEERIAYIIRVTRTGELIAELPVYFSYQLHYYMERINELRSTLALNSAEAHYECTLTIWKKSES